MNSARTLIIAGILMLFFCAGIYLYTEYDKRRFNASLPGLPPSQNQEVPSSMPDSTPKTGDTGFAVNTETEKDAGTQNASGVENRYVNTQAPAEMVEMTSESIEDTEQELWAGMTREEVHQLLDAAGSFEVVDINETYQQLFDVFTARLGPDPRISEFLDKWKAVYHILETAKDIAVSSEGGTEELEQFLGLLPTVIINDMTDLALDMFDATETEAAEVRAGLAEMHTAIEQLDLLKEASPYVTDAVNRGELTAKEGEEFLEMLSGLDVIVR